MSKLSDELLRSREICPNLPDDVHEIAGYVAERLKEERSDSPQQLALIFATILEEKEIADYEFFPQLVDKIKGDDDDYVMTFRRICQEVLDINPPFIVETKEYSHDINIAVEWWTKAVLFRDDISNMPTAFKKLLQREYTEDEIMLFKSVLAREIAKEIDEEGSAWISSDWIANDLLKIAGNKIGINPLLGYPDAAMAVYPNEVKVSVDGGHHWETIYGDCED